MRDNNKVKRYLKYIGLSIGYFYKICFCLLKIEQHYLKNYIQRILFFYWGDNEKNNTRDDKRDNENNYEKNDKV